MRLTFLSFIAILAFYSPQSLSDPNSKQSEAGYALFKKAKDLKLHEHRVWHKLIHYNSLDTKNTRKSEIKTKNFFLSEQGSVDAQSELKATIQAFFEVIPDNRNEHARCRYPARYNWLMLALDWRGVDIPIESCSEFWKWSHEGDIKEASLFFANGFMENPASFFGHAILRLSTNKSVTSGLLANTVDYGAIIPENENALIYITKGVFGGYEAGYSDGNFYRQNYNYGEIQLRDLWEYELNLTDDQVWLLTTHLWELVPNKFTYFFTYKNCGTAIADLIELIIPELELYNRRALWVLPPEIFRSLYEASDTNKIVKNINYHPSRLTKFKYNFENLTLLQAQAFTDFISYDYHIFETLTEQEKKLVLTVALDYFQLLKIRDFDREYVAERNREVLIERLKLSAGNPPMDGSRYRNEKPPHESARPSLIRVMGGYSDQHEASVLVQYRPVQYDLLSLDYGRPKNAELNIFDTTVEITPDEVRIKNIDFLNILSINPSISGLEGDRPYSWGLRVNYGQYSLGCSTCDVWSASGGYGRAKELDNGIVFYGLFEAKVQSHFEDRGIFALAPKMGFIGSSKAKFKYEFYYQFIVDKEQADEKIHFETRYQIHRDMDVRLRFEQHNAVQVSAGLSWYW